jgi:hypothetical protein
MFEARLVDTDLLPHVLTAGEREIRNEDQA